MHTYAFWSGRYYANDATVKSCFGLYSLLDKRVSEREKRVDQRKDAPPLRHYHHPPHHHRDFFCTSPRRMPEYR